MIAWMLIALVLLAGWHFVWDGIIGPSFRAEYRFALFSVRDRLRELRYRKGIDATRFWLLEESINTAIQFLPSLSIASLIESRRAIERDPELRQLIDERLRKIEDSPNEEAREILSSIVETSFRALRINNGGLLVYVIPVALAAYAAQYFQSAIQSFIALTVQEVSRSFPQVASSSFPQS